MATGAIGVMLLAGFMSSADAAAGNPGVRFMHGGTYCFAANPADVPGGGVLHFKLNVTKAQGRGESKLAAVHALERGTLPAPYSGYVNELAGTATVAASNDATLAGRQLLQVGLSGTSYGRLIEGDAQGPILWSHAYSLQLDPSTLKGTVYGVKSMSAPLLNGGQTQYTPHAVMLPVGLMPCRDF